jgi:DNA polymerase-1
MNKDFRKILDSLKEAKEEPRHRNGHVLLVDSLNTFLRSFVTVHHLNPQGNHIGGLTGFLKSVGHAIRLIDPTRVILVFDGHGGSTNKRYLYPEYKANRHIAKISNWDAFDNQDEESESITNQIVRLIAYLNCLPVDLLIIDKVEADDVIGYLAKQFEEKVTILSTDKDYLQLVSDRVTVYSPIKKKFYTPKAVTEEFGISPINFLTHKILLGDKSDNVPGVKGLGLKTLVKLLPDLKKDELVSIEQIIESSEGKPKKFGDIYNFRNQLLINKQLMDLHDVNLPEQDIEVINEVISNPRNTLDVAKFIKLYHEDRLENSIPNQQMWLYDTFNKLKVVAEK